MDPLKTLLSSPRSGVALIIRRLGWGVALSTSLAAIAARADVVAVDHALLGHFPPAPVSSGFRMDGYFVWCGSAIKADGEYHLFAARWPKATGFPEGYRENSEIVHATAKTAMGPYRFKEVVIGRRSSGYWDSLMAHNPTIHRIGDEFVLFYIGSDRRPIQAGSQRPLRTIGFATASSINGPWHRSDRPVITEESNNPAVYVDPEGKIKLMYRDARLQVRLAVADSYAGKYRTVNADVWPQARLEDFYLFKMNHRYQMICEDNEGKVTGHPRWGAAFSSADGIGDWTPASREAVYNHDIVWDNDTILHCVRRERPQLLIEDGVITHLITAVYDGINSWSQPVAVVPGLPIDR